MLFLSDVLQIKNKLLYIELLHKFVFWKFVYTATYF